MTPFSKVKIVSPDPAGHHAKVTVDGVEPEHLTRVDLKLAVNEITTVVLHHHGPSVDFEGLAKVVHQPGRSESREATQDEVAVMFIAQGAFVEAVRAERARQDRKWGRNFVGIDRMLVVLGEEIGEVCRAHLESSRATGRASLDDLKTELVQSAAVLSKLYELLEAGAR